MELLFSNPTYNVQQDYTTDALKNWLELKLTIS